MGPAQLEGDMNTLGYVDFCSSFNGIKHQIILFVIGLWVSVFTFLWNNISLISKGFQYLQFLTIRYQVIRLIVLCHQISFLFPLMLLETVFVL